MSSTDSKVDESELSPTQLATLRRKKNADAQAAFRSRRANYIANLEETVTRLEFVVRELQDNCREARDLAEETKQENMELRATITNLRQTERERERVWRALNNRTQAPSDTSSDTDGSLVAPMNSMVPMDGHMIEYQRSLAYPQQELVHQLPSPADTMNALPTYDYSQNMISYPLFPDNHDPQWNTSMSTSYPIDEPMTCSPGSQIVIPDLSEEQSMRFHNSPGTLAFDPSVVAMRHPSTPASERPELDGTLDPQTPRRLTRSRAQFRRTQSGGEPYPSGSLERRERRRGPRDTTPDGSSFSDTLAVIKAQAFGTARKTRTRANRGVSEHAARVAMEVLEARGLSLGVSLDGSDRRRRRSTRGAEDDA